MQCPTLLLSSIVSASTCPVVLGSVVLPSKRVLLLSIVILYHGNLVVVFLFSIQCTDAVPPSCSAPFHKCVCDARSPTGSVWPARSPSSCHLSYSHPIMVCCLNTVLKCWVVLSSFNKSDIFIYVCDPSRFPFQSSSILLLLLF